MNPVQWAPVFLINGEATDRIDVRDRGFQSGVGVFTTLPVMAGQPVWLDRHLTRLARDCQGIGLSYPGDALLARDIGELLREPPPAAVLKLQLTRGSGGRGYAWTPGSAITRVVSLHPPPEYPESIHATGIEAMVCQTRLGINPLLAGLKHTNRLEQILARAELQPTACGEGILLDQAGWVTEGTFTNLFLSRGGVVQTPPLDRCGVQGVMREVLLEWFSQSGHPVQSTRFGVAELYQADELMLCNSVIGVWFVRRCDHRTYPEPVHTPQARAFLRTHHLPLPL